MTNPKRRRLYLIVPRFKYKHYAAQQELCDLVGVKKMTIPVQLPLVAALTPDTWDVRIIDDEYQPLAFSPLPDLVGVTTIAATVRRVYEIADAYRSRGVPVVMGGPLASFAPEAVLAHADHVIVGEAEGSWQRFLEEFESGRAGKVYRSEAPFDISRPLAGLRPVRS